MYFEKQLIDQITITEQINTKNEFKPYGTIKAHNPKQMFIKQKSRLAKNI